MANARRLMELSMVPPLAKEVSRQMEEGGMTGTAPAVPNSTATTIAGLVSDFNGLLDALRARGVIS